MATIDEEIIRLQNLKLAGPDAGKEIIHVVFTDRDRQEKRRKPLPGKKARTRFIIDCDTNFAYRELFKEYDRIVSTIGNKSIALSIITDWLAALTPERILAKLKRERANLNQEGQQHDQERQSSEGGEKR
jgi:hypothetical protein